MHCSNCGHELLPDAKFCSNCGAPVGSGASQPPASNESDRERERREDFARAWGGWNAETTGSDSDPTTKAQAEPEPQPGSEPSPSSTDGAYTGGFSTDRKPTWEIERERLREQADDEWSMSSLGAPPPRRRRTWLWVLLGTIALVVIACCVFFSWVTFTDSGMEWFEGIATQAAEEIQRATDEAATPQP